MIPELDALSADPPPAMLSYASAYSSFGLRSALLLAALVPTQAVVFGAALLVSVAFDKPGRGWNFNPELGAHIARFAAGLFLTATALRARSTLRVTPVVAACGALAVTQIGVAITDVMGTFDYYFSGLSSLGPNYGAFGRTTSTLLAGVVMPIGVGVVLRRLSRSAD